VPHSAALATSPLENNIQALQLGARCPSREISTLSVRHHAAYFRHSDTFWSALSLRDSELYHTDRLYAKFRQRAFSLSSPAAWNSLPADSRIVLDIINFKNKLETYLIMVVLRSRCGHYIFALWFLLSSFFPRLISAVAHWMSTILPHMMWPYCEFRMQM